MIICELQTSSAGVRLQICRLDGMLADTHLNGCWGAMNQRAQEMAP